ncbi:hypothetical protein [Serinibacter arcticus]|uniref:Uncharacterized protein n=1 Tax=Serinibacter arcticus TaxID=1655435 RepID=A0A4Z1E4Z0_9MICO|nr:hypothetical protein [Serinibacter arcticus]TGO06259.1 hypothetical protein SERN_0451 [Serinibacter arcticus]
MSSTPHDRTFDTAHTAPGATPPVTPFGPHTPERPIARGPRPGTVVWGLVVIAVGVLTIVVSTGFSLDLELTAIIGLAAAGVLLLLTAVIGSARGRRR